MTMTVASLFAAPPTKWGRTEYKDQPWVQNMSKPYKVKKGLYNRHLSLWASHGYYYKAAEGQWKWQRPLLYNTREDLFTQTIVLPYLIPMLENAGAVVFTPRERDWQTDEYIIDNDHSYSNASSYPGMYNEFTNGMQSWQSAPYAAFGAHDGVYYNGENPFAAGTARTVQTTKHKTLHSVASYQPSFRKEGRYAVYVSYQSLPNSVSDAQYIVMHKGQETVVNVNQKIGGGTWVYLGTFEFDKGCNVYNRVVLTNYSRQKGVVSGDAVRFGGGTGNISRGGTTSGMLRALEGARYYAQWAGMPEKIYNGYGGDDDYKDDINTRSLMTNYVGGGSVYSPEKQGLGVPIELSLAIHSDAGNTATNNVRGTLTICTTDFNGGVLASGKSRDMSKEFAQDLLDNFSSDMRRHFGTWNKRTVWNRNYSETRLPDVPSAIIETMFHDNFEDMKIGQDPEGKFQAARSIYKTILRYVSSRHGQSCVVSPLAPEGITTEMKKGKLVMEWDAVRDPEEASATPKGYVVYTAAGTAGFDNGTYVKKTRFKMKLEPGVMYHFRVSAVNDGGESFPSEMVSVCFRPEATRTVMIVNGFHRLASPQVEYGGFNMNLDAGITYGPTTGWGGEYTGQTIAGNNFDCVRTHAEALYAADNVNILSCSSAPFARGDVSTKNIDMIDLVLGLERNDGYSHKQYKTFPSNLRAAIQRFLAKGGALMVSGAYTGSDMLAEEEKNFLATQLHTNCQSVIRESYADQITGLGTSWNIYRLPNAEHYAAQSTDVLEPVAPAFCAMQYMGGYSACVAYKDAQKRTLTMGFPFECITDKDKRATVMKAVTAFLLY